MDMFADELPLLSLDNQTDATKQMPCLLFSHQQTRSLTMQLKCYLLC